MSYYGAPPRHGYGAPPPPQYGGGGFYAPQGPPVPPGADPQLWSYFSNVDADRSGSISVTELQQALVNGQWTHPHNSERMTEMGDNRKLVE